MAEPTTPDQQSEISLLDLPQAEFEALLESIPEDTGYTEAESLLDLPKAEFDTLLGQDPVYQTEMRRATERERLLSEQPGVIQRAMGGTRDIFGRVKSEERRRKAERATRYIEGRGQVPLVEDESALGFFDRVGLSFIEDVDTKINILNEKILEDPRIDPEKHQAYYNSDTNDFVIPRYNEELGRVEDVVLDPNTTELTDIAEFVAPNVLPLLFEGFTAAKLAAKWGQVAATKIPGLLGTAAAGAAGSRAQEAAARVAYDQPQQELGELLGVGAFETGLGAVGDLAVRGGLRMLSPFSKSVREETRVAYMESLDKINRELGLDIQPTTGESTGSQLLGRAESFLKKQWALGGALKEAEAIRQRTIVDGLGRMLNRKMTPDEAAAFDPTSDILAALDQKLLRQAGDDADAAIELSEAATREILGRWDKMTTSQRFASSADAGEALRSHLNTVLTAFRKEATSKYNTVYDLIGEYKRDFGNQFDFNRLVKVDYSKLQSEISKGATLFEPQRTIDPATGLETTKQIPVIQPGQVHRNVLRMVNIAKKANDLGGMPLEFAIRFRQNVDSLIASAGGYNNAGLGKPDVKLLKQLRSNIQSGIESAADAMPSDSLSKAMRDANGFYASKADNLKTAQVNTLLNETAGRKIPDSELLAYIYSGKKGTNYEALMDTVGDKPQFKAEINRAILDAIGGESSASMTAVSVDALQKKLKGLPPSVAEGIFGKDYDQKLAFLYDLKNISEIKFQKLNESDYYIAKDAVDKFLNKPFSQETKDALSTSLKLANDRINTLKGKLTKGLTKDVADDVIQNGELAKILVDNANTQDAKRLASQIGNGSKRNALEYKLVENLLRESGMLEAVSASSSLKAFDYKSTVVGKELSEKLNRPAYRELLDPDTYDVLDEYSRMLMFQQQSGKDFGGDAASIASAGNLGEVFKKLFSPVEWTAALPAAAGYRTVAWMFSNPTIRKALSSQRFDPNNKDLMRALLANSVLMNEIQQQAYQNDPVALKDLSAVVGLIAEPSVDDDLMAMVMNAGTEQVQSQRQQQPQPAQQ
jgi:hypothetical protein